MLFNSFEFLFFLPAVFALYWALNRWLRLQNLLVVVASYVFYGWWDWRFLALIAFTSAWSYCAGLLELRYWDDPRSGRSKAVLTASLVVNLGILGYFKYCNFFLDQAVAALRAIGFEAHASTLQIILPVGISFYTFQAASYMIDVYRRQIRPTRDPVAFFAFISFFPQLVAGPIERAVNLLPQFLKPRTFDYAIAVDGMRQMLWGLFKKMVVADNCAAVANHLLNDPSQIANGTAVWMGVFFFTFQIYGDFSGYSDIAIGSAKLFGIRLMRNFAYPFFSRSQHEFWGRWHMSLMGWFKDYVYIPLGGGRVSRWKKARNTMIVFLTSGLWHGARWNYVIWGAFYGLMFLPGILLGRKRREWIPLENYERPLPSIRESGAMALTFFLFMMGFVVFRAPDISTAGAWAMSMAGLGAQGFRLLRNVPHEASIAAVAMSFMVVSEWFNRRCAYGFARYPQAVALRWVIYLAFICLLVTYAPQSQSFVYFQF